MQNVKYVNSVPNDESLCGHCTNERRVRKRDKKVRRDVIMVMVWLGRRTCDQQVASSTPSRALYRVTTWMGDRL